MMFSYGQQITRQGDQLQLVQPEWLMKMIRDPDPLLKDRVDQLRILKTLDPHRYREEKKFLPYFVCAKFNPAIRRKEHFAAATGLVLDLDHIHEGNLDLSSIRQVLKGDKRVYGYFLSPGGDGLKILFLLDAPCSDSALFSAFYKLFSTGFASEYQLTGVLDRQTHDVTRACFVSYDRDAWCRPDATPLVIHQWIPDLEFGQVEKELKQIDKDAREEVKGRPTQELDQEVMARIKAKLNPPRVKPPEVQRYVPEQVDKALLLISQKLPEKELRLVSSEPIQYGRKLRIAASGSLWAEVNLFYGKRGYSLVLTTKTGSHAGIGELAVQAIEEVLATNDLI